MSTLESPTKGKPTHDGSGWRTNWWDLHPLAEDLRRPVAWSTSSTIYTAHPTQPVIIGRLFPSSKQFLVVSPDPITHASTSYGPPTVISISPNDSWLFAFFPSHEDEGIACLWNRGCCADAWSVKEHWPFARGADVITCAWAGAEREWSTSPDGSSSRLPTRGPFTPVSNPTLLLVTQAHQLHVCYLRTYVSPLKMLVCSLTQPYFTIETQPLGPAHDIPTGPKTSRLCIHAAIAFIYCESSILIAMRSRRYPTSGSLNPAAHNDLDLSISLDIPPSSDSSPEVHIPSLEWGALMEEQTIELCEVKLRFDGTFTSLISQPLPPLHHHFPHMNSLVFVCSPPSKFDPAASPKTSPRRDKQSIRPAEPPSTFLVASLLDFEEYNATPKSTVVAYALSRTPLSPTPMKAAWTAQQVGERSLFPRVLALSCATWVSRRRGLIALLADAGGPMPRYSQRTRELAVGNIAILRLPDLTNDTDREPSPIMAPISRSGMDWPVNMVASRNEVLLCAVALCKMSIYTLPKQLTNITMPGDSASKNIPYFSTILVTALQSRGSIADIAHVLAAPRVPLDLVVDTLKGVWLAFEVNERASIVGVYSVADVLGTSVELYRTRAQQAADPDEKDFLSSLWRNAHDMCSVVACLVAFEDCREAEEYDLEAIWQLVSLSGWVVSFLERLIKECLFAADLTDMTPSANGFQPKLEPVDDVGIFSLNESNQAHLSSPLDSPVLLHLAHPFILRNLIEVVVHVNQFYKLLSALTPKGENSQMARDILMDVINCSGLNLKGIEEILISTLTDVKSLPADDVRLSLSKCHPVPAQYPLLQKVVKTLYASTAVDKPRLFIKAVDLVDGLARLSTSEQDEREQNKDVVTKGVLIRRSPGLQCLRCGYRSEVGGEVSVAGHISPKWRTWEKMWASRCICGGTWVSGNI